MHHLFGCARPSDLGLRRAELEAGLAAEFEAAGRGLAVDETVILLTLSLHILMHLLKVEEGVQQNDGLAHRPLGGALSAEAAGSGWRSGPSAQAGLARTSC